MEYQIPNHDFILGLSHCIKNAKQLLTLAYETFKNDCFQAAYLLGFASLEEIGKAIVILNHIEEEYISKEVYFKEFRNHNHKITLALNMSDDNLLEVHHGVSRDEFPILEYDDERKKMLLDIRTRSIYLDYDFEKICWRVPLSKMDELAHTIIRTADMALSHFDNELKYREIKLINHSF